MPDGSVLYPPVSVLCQRSRDHFITSLQLGQSGVGPWVLTYSEQQRVLKSNGLDEDAWKHPHDEEILGEDQDDGFDRVKFLCSDRECSSLDPNPWTQVSILHLYADAVLRGKKWFQLSSPKRKV